MEEAAYSGPIIVMYVILIESAIFVPTEFLTYGTGISLKEAHQEDTFKAVFIGSLAVWTGYWIGSNLNFQLLKYLFRDKTKEIFSKYPILSCLDKAAEVHGFKIMLFLRFCPIFVINLVI